MENRTDQWNRFIRSIEKEKKKPTSIKREEKETVLEKETCEEGKGEEEGKKKINIHFTIPLDPITKKNSQRIEWHWIRDKKTGKPKSVPYIKPSEAYVKYANDAGWFINRGLGNLSLDTPLQIKCVYYLSTRRQADLTNLLEATDDVLVKYHVIADDNYKIICSHDGSRVFYDAANPRTEIYITDYEDENYPLTEDDTICPCCGGKIENT